jgi:hypothetical protein
MVKRVLSAVVLGVLAAAPVRGASDGFGGDTSNEFVHSSSALRAEVLYGHVSNRPGNAVADVTGRRSVPLAFGMSAVVPGLGQAYNKQWIKAGVAVAVEVALITAYVIKKRDGNNGADAFKAFAHEGWSPGKYASWLNEYSVFLELNHGANVTAPDIEIPDVDFSSPEQWGSSDRSAVDAFFGEIRIMEGQMFHPETGASFSHRIPDFGDQQYYELIGKYFQFAPGWFDYPDWGNSQDGYTDAIDPERSNPDGSKVSVSESFYAYASDHADSQDLLRKASQISALILVNHLVAAIDAAVFSKIHNDRLEASVSMDLEPTGGMRPSAYLSFRF